MKQRLRLVSIAAVAFVGSFATMANSESKDLTETLQEKVAALTAQQQEALLTLLSEFETNAGNTVTKPRENALKVLKEELDAYEAAVDSGTFDVNRFLSRLSEDFNNPMMGDKKNIVVWMKSMGLFSNNVPSLEFNLDEAHVESDGDVSKVESIFVDTPFGYIELEVQGKAESDGMWRITDIALVGY